jgi:tetratricopeptide (TPR) repeat protein
VIKPGALVFSIVALLWGQPAEVRDAIAALGRGDFTGAEKTVRAELKLHPGDALAWSVLGVALDNQKRFPEAEEAHRRAVAGEPRSADILNNLANHQLAAGQLDGARATYQKVLALDSGQFNANIQLARLALQAKNGGEALRCLRNLPPERQEAPVVAALRLAARWMTGDRDAVSGARDNPGLSFGAGVALANAAQLDGAEVFLNLALEAAPTDFNALFHLGAVASRNGHHERAREALETALREQPENVDVLYTLAYTDQTLGRHEAAVALLARASKLAPQRPDIQKLLAIATSGLGALEDSAAAWDRYLRLQPDDDAARRERAFLDVQMGQVERGIAGLRAFVARHPSDPEGYFELGMAESKDDPGAALPRFDRALEIRPDFGAVRAARGSLYYQMGKPEAALPDLEAAAAARPNDAASLDHLGQTYLALDRPAEAVRALRHAAELAPEDSKTQLHLARALADAGNSEESKAAMERFRRLGPAANKAVPAGLVDYLSLTPEERHADYRGRVAKAVHEHPDDAAAQVAWLKLLLEDGKPEEAAATARRLGALKPAPALLADAAHALLELKQYGAARELLAQTGNPDGAVTADLAIADFQMLDAAGKTDEAVAALQRAMRAAPDRADLIRQAAAFRIRHGELDEALRLTGDAAKAHPGDRDVLLLRAVTLGVAKRGDEVGRALGEIQSRWPEWPAVWAARGIGLHDTAALDTAKSLGARAASVDLLELLQRPLRDW